MLRAATAAGEYLVGTVGSDGRFAYEYRPTQDEVAEGYNILRHCGTVYAMLELHEVAGSPALLSAAKRAIGYLLEEVQPCTTSQGTLPCLVEDGYTKLGGNALAVIAMAKYTEVTGDRQYLPLMQELGAWIGTAMAENGKFAVHKQSHPGGAVVDFTSAYYPGEAILALTRLYAVDSSETWLDMAENAAIFLIFNRDAGVADSGLPHDHWLLYALNELARLRPRAAYLNHSLRIANAIIRSQNRQPAYPDWLGSFYLPPRSTPTSTRMEGLCAAYVLARDAGRLQEADTILAAIRHGIGFQLKAQIGPESALYLPNPKRSLGGVRRSLTDYDIRIDYPQHFISSLLGYYRICMLNSDGAEPTGRARVEPFPSS